MQSSQVPILWKQSEGIKVDANIEVVPVVSKQPLKCMKYYTPPDTRTGILKYPRVDYLVG